MDPLRPWSFRNKKQLLENRSVKSIFCISQVLGLFPHSLEEGAFCVSSPFCVLSAITTCSVVFLTVNFTATPILHDPVTSALALDSVRHWYYLFISVLYLVSVTTSFFRSSAVNEIASMLDIVDRSLVTADFCVERNFPVYLRTKNVLGGVLSLLFLVYAPWAGSFMNIFYRLYIFFLASCIWLSSSQFSVIGYLILSRITEAYDSLNDIRPFNHSSLRTNRITLLSDVHAKLCNACHILGSSFNILNTTLVAVCFFSTTIASFYIVSDPYMHFRCYVHIIEPATDVKKAFPMIRVLSILLALICIWEILDCSTEISRKVTDLFYSNKYFTIAILLFSALEYTFFF